MRGGLARQASPTDLDRAIREVLDRRLRSDSARPLAVALSGGGDSVALLLAVATWALRAGRKLLVLHVDHGLRAESTAWAEACACRAQALGADFQALRWTGEKPRTGLPAAARLARHRLLADAARKAGARVILMGHTADDLQEAEAMRREGATTPDPREWAPSPVWPEGRGLFILRPMLTLARADIRDALSGRGEPWIEDPANEDQAYARARARGALQPDGTLAARVEPVSLRGLAEAFRMDAAGVLTAERETLRQASLGAAARMVAMASVCAAGTERPPARARAERLAERLRGCESMSSTLAGARVEADAGEVRFLREAGEAARGGLKAVRLGNGVWDGRFEIAAAREFEIAAAAGRMAALSPRDRAELAGVPPRARPTLPTIVQAGGPALLLGDLQPGVRAAPLALSRLQAAAGVIEREEP